jgi:hypothetical protein
MNDHAMMGLMAVRVPFVANKSLLAPETEIDINGQGLDRHVEGDTVTYSYYLKEYRDRNVSRSEEENRMSRELEMLNRGC